MGILMSRMYLQLQNEYKFIRIFVSIVQVYYSVMLRDFEYLSFPLNRLSGDTFGLGFASFFSDEFPGVFDPRGLVHHPSHHSELTTETQAQTVSTIYDPSCQKLPLRTKESDMNYLT